MTNAKARSSKGVKSRIPVWLRSCGGVLLLGILILILGYPALIGALGGAWSKTDGDWQASLSPAAKELLQLAYADLDSTRLVDVHVHLAGIGSGGSGCEVHPNMLSWSSPRAHVRFELYLSASGVENLERADQEFVERLTQLIASAPGAGRFGLMAFDHAYHEDGSVNLEHSEFYVPNEWVWQTCQIDPQRLLPVISVHPYRRDALQELERWAAKGARLVKWLPNAMGIDPASSLCDEFYAKMVELDLTLLTHTGLELAVEATELQALGNPLRLRRALDRGVRVIAAHCASLGDDLDLDQPAANRPRLSSFELFLRLMGEPKYDGLLFGEISAVTLVNRLDEPLRVLLERKDLHARLVNGSDYPLPTLNAVIHLRPLVNKGFLTEDQAEALREIYDKHPLVFDLVLKRTLRSPTTGEGFAPEVFLSAPSMGF
ncbi:MAG: hypothetical protein ACI8X5_001978 [Planctomycetota bacterium]|jgi:hypothetical protein